MGKEDEVGKEYTMKGEKERMMKGIGSDGTIPPTSAVYLHISSSSEPQEHRGYSFIHSFMHCSKLFFSSIIVSLPSPSLYTPLHTSISISISTNPSFPFSLSIYLFISLSICPISISIETGNGTGNWH